MTANESLRELFKVLRDQGASYMIVGSYSSNFYGIPRSTKDADLVINVDATILQEVAKHLPDGIRFEEQGFFEMVTATRKELLLVDAPSLDIFLGERRRLCAKFDSGSVDTGFGFRCSRKRKEEAQSCLQS